MKNIICLEGLSGSGKTTLINLLSKDTSIDTVEEIYLDLDKPMDQEFCLRNDHAKFAKAKELVASKTVFVDRGYGSTLAHDFALITDNPQRMVESTKAFKAAINNDLLPDKIIYLDISCEKSLERKDRPISDDIWTQIDYLKEIKHYYDNLMQKHFNNTEIIRLNGDQEIEVLHKLITSKI